MDSMRALNTSLPTPPPPPPEQLLQAFKNAALSVTNLYKAAAADQSQIRHNGYQEAIADLLSFLDDENLGLQDGEGWRVRQWATERLDGLGAVSDDERDDVDKTRGSSPVSSRKPHREPESRSHRSATSSSPAPSNHVESIPTSASAESHPLTSTPIAEAPSFTPRSTAFTFTAGPSLPQSNEVEMQSTDNSRHRSKDCESDSETETTSRAVTASTPSRTTRTIRTPHRLGGMTRNTSHSSSRDNSNSWSQGTKRKVHFPDFFDIQNIGNGKDHFGGGSGGGGKRSRFL